MSARICTCACYGLDLCMGQRLKGPRGPSCSDRVLEVSNRKGLYVRLDQVAPIKGLGVSDKGRFKQTWNQADQSPVPSSLVCVYEGGRAVKWLQSM